ncbi:MAG TPA: hypothetical protein PLK06_01895 [bacterium]|nr:hypothetical protein [bacterium]
MSESKRMGDYALRKIGSGAESEVFLPKNRLKKGSTEKGIVLKNMSGLGENNALSERRDWVANEHGFDERYRQVLEAHHRALRDEYGSIMAPVRYVKNPDHPELYLLAQEHFDLAEPAPVTEYYPVDVEDEAVREQLRNFVKTLKKNILLQEQDKPAIVPDLFPENLVFTKDLDKIAYIDSGLNGEAELDHDTHLQVVALELLSGAGLEQILNDPFYTNMFEAFPDLRSLTDEHDFYHAVKQHEGEIVNGLIDEKNRS